MKYMNWSWADLMSAPQFVVDEIIAVINEQETD